MRCHGSEPAAREPDRSPQTADRTTPTSTSLTQSIQFYRKYRKNLSELSLITTRFNRVFPWVRLRYSFAINVPLMVQTQNSRVAHLSLGGMTSMRNLITKLLRDESGVTMIEYGLMGALVAVVIIGAVTIVGTRLQSTFTAVGNNL